MQYFLFYLIIVVFIEGCGVKGDPSAPLLPAELGRGQPTYKKATEDLVFPEVPAIDSEVDAIDEDQEENETE